MIGDGVGGCAEFMRLPALYLRCRDSLTRTPRPLELIGRIVQAKVAVGAVVFITIGANRGQPEVFSPLGPGGLRAELRDMLLKLGFSAAVRRYSAPHVAALTGMLFGDAPVEQVELRLSIDMTMDQYRDVGQSLRSWRERRVLLVCLDQIPADADPDGYRAPHDPYWRNLMGQWVEQQQWDEATSALSLQVGPPVKLLQRSLGDGSHCLLYAAFVLGGLRLPARLFGFDLDDSQRAVFGYGWMS